MRSPLSLLPMLRAVIGALAAQSPFASPRVYSLSSVQPGEVFTTVTSDLHPHHKLRIKSHDKWCEPNAKSYTGYLDTPTGDALWFYFFESRDKPKEDPVVMWINGGPGGSSAMGLFMEQGPCKVKENPETPNDTIPNPYAWNEKANVFFLDQPVGVGFSHAEYGQVISRTEMAAKDVAAFVHIFFDTFKEYHGRAFHMTGESYGGRYLPVFASEIYDQNTQRIQEGKEPINLKSVMIGNGATSFFTLVESIYNFMCTKQLDLGRAMLDINRCVYLAEEIPKCTRNLQKHCLDTNDYTTCSIWWEHCEPLWGDAPAAVDLNRYNVNQTCTQAQREEYNCLKETMDIEKYLNLDATRSLLGVDAHTPKWTMSSHLVAHNFNYALDMNHQTWFYVANLLERGVRVLNYVGTLDAACDLFGQSRWMAAMEWSGQQAYLDAPTEKWMVDGEVAGNYKNAGDLTLLKIYGAGHLVPTDKPKEALTMFNEWIAASGKYSN